MSVIQGVTDLQTLYPEIAKEWDYEKNKLSPTQVSAHSQQVAWFVCPQGHHYDMRIGSRTNKTHQNCPYCSGKRVSDLNSLEYNHPEVLTEFDYEKNKLNPSQISYSSAKKIFWLCEKGHSYEMAVCNKVARENGCPYCANKRILVGYNDIATTHPDLVKEWNYEKNIISPQEIVAGSHTKVWWKCNKCGGEWEQNCKNRTTNNSGCPYCKSVKTLVGYNDLATTHPDLVKEWDYEHNTTKPTEIRLGHRSKVWWKCNKGHRWQATVNARTTGHTSCPICSGSRTELLVREYLINNGINFEIEKNFEDFRLFFYDIYLPNSKICIEIDGQQHFEYKDDWFEEKYTYDTRKYKDSRKNTYCYNHGILILRIQGLDYSKKLIEDYKNWVYNTLDCFLSSHLVPNDIIEFYKQHSETNYSDIAILQNKLVEERRNQCQIQN